jgi:DnaJ-domain-containing protein 1
MSWPAAIAVGLALFLYLRSPIDLVPARAGAIGLVDDLLVLVTSAWWIRPRLARPTPPAPRPTPGAAWDPWAVLGVARGATAAEITHAYREQMKRYHPDRVADLGEELRRLAHEKALDIQRAYAEIGPS